MENINLTPHKIQTKKKEKFHKLCKVLTVIFFRIILFIIASLKQPIVCLSKNILTDCPTIKSMANRMFSFKQASSQSFLYHLHDIKLYHTKTIIDIQEFRASHYFLSFCKFDLHNHEPYFFVKQFDNQCLLPWTPMRSIFANI